MARDPRIMSRLIAADQIASRLQLHRMMHAILTLSLFWPSYIFLDDIPSFVPQSQSYSWMAAMMTEEHWGYCCLIPALFGSITLYSRGWGWRMAGAGVLAAAHAALAFSFWLGKHDGVIVGFIGCLSFSGCALAYSTANIGIRLARSMESPRK